MVAYTPAREFQGIYEVPETARYLQATILTSYKVPPAKLIRWIRLGLADPHLKHVRGRDLLIEFEDLISLRVIALLRAYGRSFRAIRDSEKYLRGITGHFRPFATETLWIEEKGARSIYAELAEILVIASRGGQMAFMELVQEKLIRVHGMTFDEGGIATSWTPRPGILLHPEIQFGRPCIEGTRIPANAIAGMVEAGDSIDYLAASYGITDMQVQSAVDWEREIAAS